MSGVLKRNSASLKRFFAAYFPRCLSFLTALLLTRPRVSTSVMILLAGENSPGIRLRQSLTTVITPQTPVLTWKHAILYSLRPANTRKEESASHSWMIQLATRSKKVWVELQKPVSHPVPKWAHGDREVLRFYGYFQESVSDSEKK